MIINNFLSIEELEFVRKILSQDRWGFGFLSTDPSKPIWNFDKQTATPIALLLASKLKLDISDWHVNGQTFMLDGAPHTDNYSGCDTAAVFFPYEWKPEWGGGLHVDGDVIIPECNKIVIFDASHIHWAEAPLAPVLRVSIGLKLNDRTRNT